MMSSSGTIPIKRISLPAASKQPDTSGEYFTELQKPPEGNEVVDSERVIKLGP